MGGSYRHENSSALRGCRLATGEVKALRDQKVKEQESRSVARKPRDAAAVLFGLKLADNIHYKFIQASKARLQTAKH